MSSKKMRPDPELNSGAADAIAAAEAKSAAAQAAQTEALAELAAAKTKAWRLSSTDMDCDSDKKHVPAGVAAGSSRGHDQSAPGADSGSAAPMDIVEEDHTALGAGPAPRDTQSGLFTGASGESQKPLLKGHCKFCQQNFEHPSFVAYFYDEPGMPFAKLTEPVVQKVNVCVFGACHLTAPRAG